MSQRSLTRRWLALVLALVLAAGACSDDDAGDVDAGAPSEEPSEAGGDEATATTASGGPAGGDEAGDGTSGTPAQGGGSGGAAPGGTASGGAAGGASGQPGGGGGPAAPAADQPTAAGTYHYTVDGTARQGTNEEQLPDQTLKVAPPQGAIQSQAQTADDGSSRQELVLEFKADGIYLHELRISDSGLNKQWKFSPPPVAFPATTAPGTAWSWAGTSDDGQTKLEGRFEITGGERLTIGGQPVDTMTIHAVISTSGDLTSTSDETWWVSPQHRLIVKTAGSTTGSFGPFSFSSQQTSVLDSLQPA